MEQLYRPSSYFSKQQTLRKQEQELEKLLKDRLPNSDIGAALFELLAVKREMVRDLLCKEGGEKEKGAAGALKELIDLFKPK